MGLSLLELLYFSVFIVILQINYRVNPKHMFFSSIAPDAVIAEI